MTAQNVSRQAQDSILVNVKFHVVGTVGAATLTLDLGEAKLSFTVKSELDTVSVAFDKKAYVPLGAGGSRLWNGLLKQNRLQQQKGEDWLRARALVDMIFSARLNVVQDMNVHLFSVGRDAFGNLLLQDRGERQIKTRPTLMEKLGIKVVKLVSDQAFEKVRLTDGNIADLVTPGMKFGMRDKGDVMKIVCELVDNKLPGWSLIGGKISEGRLQFIRGSNPAVSAADSVLLARMARRPGPDLSTGNGKKIKVAFVSFDQLIRKHSQDLILKGILTEEQLVSKANLYKVLMDGVNGFILSPQGLSQKIGLIAHALQNTLSLCDRIFSKGLMGVPLSPLQLAMAEPFRKKQALLLVNLDELKSPFGDELPRHGELRSLPVRSLRIHSFSAPSTLHPTEMNLTRGQFLKHLGVPELPDQFEKVWKERITRVVSAYEQGDWKQLLKMGIGDYQPRNVLLSSGLPLDSNTLASVRQDVERELRKMAYSVPVPSYRLYVWPDETLKAGELGLPAVLKRKYPLGAKVWTHRDPTLLDCSQFTGEVVSHHSGSTVTLSHLSMPFLQADCDGDQLNLPLPQVIRLNRTHLRETFQVSFKQNKLMAAKPRSSEVYDIVYLLLQEASDIGTSVNVAMELYINYLDRGSLDSFEENSKREVVRYVQACLDRVKHTVDPKYSEENYTKYVAKLRADLGAGEDDHPMFQALKLLKRTVKDSRAGAEAGEDDQTSHPCGETGRSEPWQVVKLLLQQFQNVDALRRIDSLLVESYEGLSDPEVLDSEKLLFNLVRSFTKMKQGFTETAHQQAAALAVVARYIRVFYGNKIGEIDRLDASGRKPEWDAVWQSVNRELLGVRMKLGDTTWAKQVFLTELASFGKTMPLSLLCLAAAQMEEREFLVAAYAGNFPGIEASGTDSSCKLLQAIPAQCEDRKGWFNAPLCMATVRAVVPGSPSTRLYVGEKSIGYPHRQLADGTVVLLGHADKQPVVIVWREPNAEATQTQASA